MSATCVKGAVTTARWGFKWGAVFCAVTLMRGPDLTARAGEAPTLDAGGSRRLTCEVLRALAEPGDTTAGKNIVFSPLGIGVVLDALRVGSRGETRRQIEAILCVSNGSPGISIAKRSAADGFGLASSLWVARDRRVEPDFEATLREGFGAPVSSCDFGQADAAASGINAWVNETSGGQMGQLVAPADVGPRTLLAVVNAAWFRRGWAQSFDPAKTAEGVFHLEGGASVRVPMMSRGGTWPYTEQNGVQALELEFDGGAYGLVCLLPAEGSDQAFRRSLETTGLEEMLSSLRPRGVDVTLPRFQLEETLPAIDVLRDLRVRDAFDSETADFRGIHRDGGLYVSAFRHRARLKVDEAGAEAAAGTAAVVTFRSFDMNRAVFKADRPFIFLLRDRRDGAILFAGRVARLEATVEGGE